MWLFLLACAPEVPSTEAPVIGPAQEHAAAPAQLRIISLHDTTTEILVGLGGAGDLIAVTEPRFLSDAAEGQVSQIMRLPSGALSAEALLAHRPGLVLGTDVVVERQPELTASLKAAGVQTLWIDPAGLDGLWSAVEQVAASSHHSQRAPDYIAQLKAQLAPPLTDPEITTAEPVRVFFYDCCSPPFTAGGRAPATELLARMGAQNIFADLDQDWGTVSWESIIARRPELVVVHDYDWDGQKDRTAKLAALAGSPLSADIPRVVVPLSVVLEGPRSLELPALLDDAIQAARAARTPADSAVSRR